MQSFRIITPQIGEPFTIGRKPDNSLVLDNPMVSRYHAVLEFEDKHWNLKSLTQNSVTQVNGNNVESAVLEDGDTILIGPMQLRATLKRGNLQLLLMESVERDLVQTKSLSNNWEPLDSLHMDIPEGCTARLHAGQAEISFKDKIVNTQGKSTRLLQLAEGQMIRLPGCTMSFAQGELTCKNLPLGFDVEVENLDVFAGKKQLLSGIDFKLHAGEILAIIGRSGQGKSTLLRLLQGKHKSGPDSYVQIGKLDYRNEEIRKHIAFLEQDPELRRDLTVKETLLDGARVGMSKLDFKRNAAGRLEKFSELFGLSARLDNPIRTLSGGECRRVALAKELMGNPGLIVLDEPLSGLDPYNSKILCTHLKQLAFLGHTIILTTHSYEALEIADKVLVLHQGKQAFYGTPKEAYRYFESDDPETILTNLNDDTASNWQTILQNRVSAKIPSIKSTSSLDALIPSYFPKTNLSPVFLYKISLTAKQWFRDKGKFLTLLLQPLIIGFLFSQIFSDVTSLWIVAFAIILSANWLSLSLSIREIVQEKEILQAEFRKGVPILPTIFAKAVLPTLVAFIQTFIVFAFVGFRTHIWPTPPMLLAVILLMVLPPVAVGLAVSSLSKNAGQANAMLPLLIIPQVALAGALVPLDQMQAIGRALSTVIWSRYNQASLLNLLLERKDSIENTILALVITLCFYIVVAIKLNWSKKAK
jgi:ABC-type multidrug transport system ATPase subunit/pSer/pThr/pTyr-binding forkhead associated (FHA) protein